MARDDSDENGGGASCLRVSLILVNFVTALAGLAGIGGGIWLLQYDGTTNDDGSALGDNNTPKPAFSDDSFYGYVGTGDLRCMSFALIGLGSIVAFVSGVGILGSCFKSRCLLVSYLSTVVLILILQILVAVFGFVYREPMTNSLREELLINLKSEYTLSPPSETKANWDLVQTKFQCCGVNEYTDWFKAKAWPNSNYVPDSCCSMSNSTDCGRSDNPTMWYKTGCYEKINQFIFEQLHILGSIVITLVFLQLFGIIASTLLFYHAKPPKPKSPQYKAYLYERARM